MKISELKKIASRRSKGPWKLAPADKDIPEDYVYVVGQQSESWPSGYPVAEYTDCADAEFIVMADSHFDALLEVAEAAKKYSKGTWHTWNCLYPDGSGKDDCKCGLTELELALAKLEGI